MSSNIPDEIKKKIDGRFWILNEDGFDDSLREYSDYVKAQNDLRRAAQFGYSLALTQLEAQSTRIKQNE